LIDNGIDLGLIAILVSVMTAGFAGYQAWIGARQIRIQRAAQDYGPGHVLTQSLIDVLDLVMQATHRLPGFAVNKEGWGLYACEAFDLSAALRQEVTEHPKWWPTLSQHLQDKRPEAVFRQTLEVPSQEPRLMV